MLRLPGIGPKKVKALYDQLGIDDLDKLKAACETGQVAGLKGFGKKTQDKILEGIAFVGQASERVRLDQAMALAQIVDRRSQEMSRRPCAWKLCGSLRRRRETCKDIDILISSADARPIMDAFVKLPVVQRIVGHGETKSSVTVALDKIVMNADLRVVSDEQFPFALNYFTGSKEHNVALRQRAIAYGLKLNEYELAGPTKSVPCKEEADIYRALDLDYVEPEMREQTGEIDAAAEHRLPQLIEPGDLTGTFHCHTTWSDGAASLEQMAQAAHKLGLKYLGIARSFAIADRGQRPDARARPPAASRRSTPSTPSCKGIHLFKGTEVRHPAPTAGSISTMSCSATFDYVVASVHSHFNQTQEEMTARIIKAISHPRVTMLGHATGRLLLRRDGYKVDLDAVLQAAAKHGTMIEINANPYRLDLDWIHCKRARALGVKLVINPDAHDVNEIAYTSFGIDVARRGWLEKKDVFNTQSLAQIKKALAAMRQR